MTILEVCDNGIFTHKVVDENGIVLFQCGSWAAANEFCEFRKTLLGL